MICWLGCQTRSLGHFLALDKMTYEPRAARVIDHSRMNLTTHRNFEVFSAADFLAAVTQHPPSLKLRRTGIPDGWLARRSLGEGGYSNKARGHRAKTSADAV